MSSSSQSQAADDNFSLPLRDEVYRWKPTTMSTRTGRVAVTVELKDDLDDTHITDIRAALKVALKDRMDNEVVAIGLMCEVPKPNVTLDPVRVSPASSEDIYERAARQIYDAPCKANFTPPPPTAVTLLREAAAQIEQRAAVRDLPHGERSMARTVDAFNCLYGTVLSETQGWAFMQMLKLARASAGAYHADDYVDNIGYGALTAESAAREHGA